MNTKTVLGLDLGSNSIGWALLKEEDGQVTEIIDLGSRIFNKAVSSDIKVIPKNKTRRDSRLARRVIQRRARRKQRMINYLISLDLLPRELSNNFGREKLLNKLGNPYELRTRGLDQQLKPHELGRVLLHFVARRGFLSSKKQIAGDLIDDPDTLAYLTELDDKPDKDKKETALKTYIAEVYKKIKASGAGTLGEYLFNLKNGKVKRNRSHDGGHLPTDRAMYKDELEKIWQTQAPFFEHLPDDFMQDNQGVKKIIFYQRPLKLKKDRVGRCSLESEKSRANTARLEVQRFRYLQDVNNLEYLERQTEQLVKLDNDKRQKLIHYFEHHPKITITAFRKLFGFDKKTEINLEAKNLKGNVTACEIRSVIGKQWDEMDDKTQSALFEDLFTIKKKSALKNRLIRHWKFDTETSIKLCLIEFEPSHSNLSLKAINKLLPYLEQGLIYSKKDKNTGEIGALQAAGYDEKDEENDSPLPDKLQAPPETSNPIVNKGLHELKRVINAIIKEYGKPDVIRIEMARDLEMNTQRFKDFFSQQKKNQKTNEEAEKEFLEQNPSRHYASRNDKIKYHLWKEQGFCCAYSGNIINKTALWTDSIEIDHIVPRSLCLDDSYINKVVCFAAENREKGQRTPIDAWSGNEYKWNQITQRIERFYPDRPWKRHRKDKTHPKKLQFYMRQEDITKKYGMSATQLNDTRYISKLAQEYVAQLVGKKNVSVTKGVIVAEVRKLWGLNRIIGQTNKKERTDHRHHAIDAIVIAHIGRGFHNNMTQAIKYSEETGKKFHLDQPYEYFRAEVKEKVGHIIVSHATQRKLSGALHEKTGAGYIAKHDGLVYRKTLNPDFTIQKAQRIVDKTVRELVTTHIANHDGSVKEAMAATIYHKDGKTPIKRVRVLQSKTTEKKLAQAKFGVKDKSGKIFKYMSYGNTHHVEIIRHKQTGKVTGEFVTMMLASQRAKGISMNKQPIIKTEHGENYEFIMALHINDTVSIENDKNEQILYRVQKIDIGAKRFILRLGIASTLQNKDEEIYIGINQVNFDKYKIKLHHINAIGHFIK